MNFHIFSKLFHKRSKKTIILILIILYRIITYKYNLKKEIRICLCVIAKNENLYAREFVERYKNIGYNKIFLYDNNDKNGEHFEEVINDYIQTEYVKIIDFREIIHGSPQHYAYQDCYRKNNKSYDWLSFYDMDEFLEINKKYKNVQDYLKDKIFDFCQNIKINRLEIINKNILYYENKTLKERIKPEKENISPDIRIKSTYRGNLSVNIWEKSYNPHTSLLNITSCSCSGKVIKFDSPYNIPPDLTKAKLKHYYYKSFEEYCLKNSRGQADRPKGMNKKIINENFKSLYLENKNDSKKLQILFRIFNVSLYNFKEKMNITQ